MGALAIQYDGMPEALQTFDEVSQCIFSVIFLVEMLLLISVLGLREYLSAPSTCFDGFVTIMSGVDTVLWLHDCKSSTIIRVMRSMRVFRVVRALLILPSLRLMLAAVRTELKSMSSIFMGILMGSYVYGVAGWILFGDDHLTRASGTTDGLRFADQDPANLPLDHYLNFDDLIAATCKMFVLATGTEWTETMSLAYDDKYVPKGVNVTGWRAIVMFFFISHIILFFAIVLNLFVMVICDAFDLLHNPYRDEIEVQLHAYTDAWKSCDTKGKGSLPLVSQDDEGRGDLAHLLKLTPMPIGARGASHTHHARKPSWSGFQAFGYKMSRQGLARSPSPSPNNPVVTEKLAVIENKGTPLQDGTYTFHEIIRVLAEHHIDVQRAIKAGKKHPNPFAPCKSPIPEEEQVLCRTS